MDNAQSDAMTAADIDALVELPTYRAAPAWEPPERRKAQPRAKRSTLLDRLVSTAGVDRVVIDVAALERDIDSLRDA